MDLPESRLRRPYVDLPTVPAPPVEVTPAAADVADAPPAPRPAPRGGRLYLSPSQISTLDQCPRQWWMAKRRTPRAPRAPGADQLVGTAVHAAIEHDIETRRRAFAAGDRESLDLPELYGVYGLALDRALAAEDPLHLLGAETRRAMIAPGRASLAAYHQHFNRPGRVFYPVATEFNVTFALASDPSVTVTGRVDGMTGVPPADLLLAGETPDDLSATPTIFDWKTTKRAWAPGAEYEGLQPPVYSLGLRASGRNVRRFSYVTFPREAGTPEEPMGARAATDVRLVDLDRVGTESAERKIAAAAESVRRMDRAGEYPVRFSRLCCWCDVLGSCEEGQRFIAERGWKPEKPLVTDAMMGR